MLMFRITKPSLIKYRWGLMHWEGVKNGEGGDPSIFCLNFRAWHDPIDLRTILETMVPKFGEKNTRPHFQDENGPHTLLELAKKCNPPPQKNKQTKTHTHTHTHKQYILKMVCSPSKWRPPLSLKKSCFKKGQILLFCGYFGVIFLGSNLLVPPFLV